MTLACATLYGEASAKKPIKCEVRQTGETAKAVSEKQVRMYTVSVSCTMWFVHCKTGAVLRQEGYADTYKGITVERGKGRARAEEKAKEKMKGIAQEKLADQCRTIVKCTDCVNKDCKCGCGN